MVTNLHIPYPRIDLAPGEQIISLANSDVHWECLVELGNAILFLAGKATQRKLVLDLEKVHYLTGASLGMLVILHQSLRIDGRGFVIRNANSRVQEILRITGLSKVFAIDIAGLPDPNQTALV